jgi:hypothetical protein
MAHIMEGSKPNEKRVKLLDFMAKDVQYLAKLIRTVGYFTKTKQALTLILETSSTFRRFLRIIESCLISLKIISKQKLSLENLGSYTKLLFNLIDHYLLNKNLKSSALPNPSTILFRNFLWFLNCFIGITAGCYKTAKIRQRIQNLVFSI